MTQILDLSGVQLVSTCGAPGEMLGLAPDRVRGGPCPPQSTPRPCSSGPDQAGRAGGRGPGERARAGRPGGDQAPAAGLAPGRATCCRASATLEAPLVCAHPARVDRGPEVVAAQRAGQGGGEPQRGGAADHHAAGGGARVPTADRRLHGRQGAGRPGRRRPPPAGRPRRPRLPGSPGRRARRRLGRTENRRTAEELLRRPTCACSSPPPSATPTTCPWGSCARPRPGVPLLVVVNRLPAARPTSGRCCPTPGAASRRPAWAPPGRAAEASPCSGWSRGPATRHRRRPGGRRHRAGAPPWPSCRPTLGPSPRSRPRRCEALAGLPAVVDEVAGDLEADRHRAAMLRGPVQRAYDGEQERLGAARRGDFLRGEVMRSWQEFVGLGDVSRWLSTGIGRVRSWVSRHLHPGPGRPGLQQTQGRAFELVRPWSATPTSPPARPPSGPPTRQGRCCWRPTGAMGPRRSWRPRPGRSSPVAGPADQDGRGARAQPAGVRVRRTPSASTPSGWWPCPAVFAHSAGLTGGEAWSSPAGPPCSTSCWRP